MCVEAISEKNEILILNHSIYGCNCVDDDDQAILLLLFETHHSIIILISNKQLKFPAHGNRQIKKKTVFQSHGTLVKQQSTYNMQDHSVFFFLEGILHIGGCTRHLERKKSFYLFINIVL